MAAQAVIVLQGLDKRTLFRIEKILQQPERVLKQIGAVVLADAQKAFRNQQLGEIRWASRYPKQAPPFINIAGVVADFAAGRKKPPPRRFDNRPAGIDTGLTLRSLTPSKSISVQGYVVTVRSASPNAATINSGGISRQPITATVKTLLGNWMKTERKSYKRKVKKGLKDKSILQGTAAVKKAALRFGAVQKMGFIFSLKTLVTRVGKRPFLGITDESKRKIMAILTGQFLPRSKGTP